MSKQKTAKVKDPQRVRRGKTAIKKGKQFERDVANLLGHIFPEAKRHIESQADEAIHGVDLSNTDRFKIQCKNKQNYVSVSTIYEVKLTSEEDIPVLVTKGNRLETMTVLPFRCFIELLEIAYGLRAPFISQEDRGKSKEAQFIKSLPLFNNRTIEYQGEVERAEVTLIDDLV